MATIREVAKKAGVSIAAVSRILNMDETLSVSNDTKRRVFQAADELKYVKKAGRTDKEGKRAEKRPLVGIINRIDLDRELEDVYFMSIRIAIEEKLSECGYRVLNINPNSTSIKHVDQKFDGCIVIGKIEGKEADEILECCENVVIVDNRYNIADADYVGVDLSNAIENVMDYLYKNGHRKIAIIADTLPEDADSHDRKLDARIRGYVSYVHEKGIYDERLFIKVPYFSTVNAYEALKKKFEEGIIPTAIISCNDSMASGAYKAINEAGYVIGTDISVVGFNDQPSAEYLIPSLTTVRFPVRSIGYEAVNIIREKLTEGREYKKVVMLKSELIVRESTDVAIDGIR